MGISASRVVQLAAAGQLRCQATEAGRIFLAEDVEALAVARAEAARANWRIKAPPAEA